MGDDDIVITEQRKHIITFTKPPIIKMSARY